MWRSLKAGLRNFLSVLVSDTIPVWLSLVLMLCGAVATYYIAPLINEQFEMQTARREFLVKNLEEFSGNAKTLIDVVSKAVNEKSQFKFDSLVADANPSISKLQFSATQLMYIVPDNHENILEFQKTLDALQDKLVRHQAGSDSAPIMADAKNLMKQSLLIYDALLKKTGLSRGGAVSTAD